MRKDTFRIVPRGPFSWSGACSVFTNFRPLHHVAKPSDDGVALSLLADADFTPVSVRLRYDSDGLHGKVSDAGLRDVVERQVARILSLDHDGTGWDDIPLERIYPGLRQVGFSSPYETACWAIVSQRISKTQAARVFASLVERRGHFPTPKELLRIDSVRGLAPFKIDRLHAVAAAALDGALDADRLRALGDEDGPASLRRIPGIGPFWSSGIYLRGCGIKDVFPDEPLSLAALARVHPGRVISEITDSFKPFRMWACFLLRVADARGLLDTSSLAA